MYQPISEEVKERIKEMYRDMSDREISRALHLSKSTVGKYAKRMGLQHADGLIEAKMAHREKPTKITESMRQRISARKKAVYESELRRKVLGLPVRTKYKYSLLSKSAKQACRYLCYGRGYFRDEDDDWVLYYDEETRRSPNEAYFLEKYRFRFVEAV